MRRTWRCSPHGHISRQRLSDSGGLDDQHARMDSVGDRPRVPSGTTLRFVSLVLLAVATTLQIFGQYASVWPAGATAFDNARCQVRSGLYLTSSLEVDPDESKWDGYRACMATFLGARALWLVG